jgi:hypothetical protein
MDLQQRIQVLVKLGTYLQENGEALQQVKENAYRQNPWFVPEFIDTAIRNIAVEFLQEDKLTQWVGHYNIPQTNANPETVGIVMAGNLPLVGFHDLLCVFITGHKALVKLSSKDSVLLKHLVQKMVEFNAEVEEFISFAEYLKGCGAYIATGSNNSARYFDYYFGKYPHIIRRNRTSAAILDGNETEEELLLLADDIQLYFGLGCRNVTKMYVPAGYDFLPLLNALRKYDHFSDFHKYRHNFDYHLALLLMNNKYYMTNESVILTENISPFSPVSQVHYEYYVDIATLEKALEGNTDIQCLIGHKHLPFGVAQSPSLLDYADGIDTMAFLKTLG